MNRVLEVGYALKLSGKEFKIKKVVGKGASSVTYLAKSNKTEHILKECNPLGISMHRNETGELVADTELSRQKFEECLERFKAGADKQLSFRLTENLKNPTSNIQDIYYTNGTAYIDMTYFRGKTYDKEKHETLYDLFRRMKALTQIVGHYHKLGYLHLDIKPQNIYTIPETPEMVMMFDFDSVTSINDISSIISSSYTDVWAAPEQKLPKYRCQICEATDLFAIGEIIFFRLFGKHSEEKDRYSFSQYKYPLKRKKFENVNPSVLPMITELLHKTLSCSVKKRYQKAEELVEQLDKIIEFSNPKEPFLKSSLPNVSGFFTGRDAEIEEIHKRLQENNVLFLSGIGGIGKSELVKHYAEAYKNSYDVIVFAPFLHDIQTMMTNDSYVQIHNFFQYPEEKPNEYFERKMRELAKLCNERTLIIVDNFDTTEDENLSRLFSLNCKMLITTRRDFTESYPDFQLDLGTLTNPFDIFNEHYKKPLSDDEHKCVDEIIEIVCGHTMTVELLAKQMMAGRVKPEKMLGKLKGGGISESGKEKVFHVNEKGEISRENTYDHIQALFDLSDLDKDEKYVLANLSLIPHTGIPAELFGEWCEFDNFDTINNLAAEGWIRWDKEKDYISLHPVVSEIFQKSNPKSSVFASLFRNLKKYIDSEDKGRTIIVSERIFLEVLSSKIINVIKTYQYSSCDVGNVLRSIGDFYYRNINYDMAEQIFNLALDIHKETVGIDSYEYMCSYISVGMSTATLGRIRCEQDMILNGIQIIELCLEKFHQGILGHDDLYEEISTAYNYLGMAYDDLPNTSKSIEMYEKGKQILENRETKLKKDYLGIAIAYHNIAWSYDMHLKNYDLACENYEKSLYYYRKIDNESAHIVKALYYLGAIYADDTYSGYDLSKSHILAKEGLSIAKKLFDDKHPLYIHSLCLYGKTELLLGNESHGKECLMEAFSVYKLKLKENHPTLIWLRKVLNV